jgi:pimeloyl-ACP methyl ester carboxylesterase
MTRLQSLIFGRALLRCAIPTVAILAVVGASATASAQSNVRAWHARGQVFVVWRVDATAPLTYDVYRASAPITSTAQGVLAGRLFEPEWTGSRLKLVKDTATWRVPTPSGGFYQLAANEGLFVYTPRAAGSEHFAVVKNGVTAVVAANLTPAPVPYQYDPVNDPVQCHLQVADVTSRDYPFRTFAMWVDGDNVAANARPDFPLMANAAKRGAPHVFTVYEPKAGLPAGPLPAVVCLHGGGGTGSHWSWAPESVHYANTDATPTVGVTVAMDDRLFVASNGVVSLDRPTNWFGWHPGMDPITALPAPSTAVVVPYTLRRLVWTLDWLQTRSPYAIDATRTAVMGNSMGGAGTLLLSRWRPERFSAATAFVPQHYTPDTGSRLFGTPALNLLTSEVGPNGTALRVNDFFDAAVRLSPLQRDFCFTRIVRGRRDEAVDWGPEQLQLFNAMNAGRHGTHLYWDNRDHTASDWTTDDPSTPWVDIAEWIVPVRTARMGAPYQTRYRARQSYPAFHDDDQDPTTAGRQPTLGNGSPDNGTPWGTWGGYFDWDAGTLFDVADGWACTMYLIGQSPVAVDNFPGSSATTSLTVRMPRRFTPPAGVSVAWTLRDGATDAPLQSGAVAVGADGLVTLTGLPIPRDPARVRLECRVGAAPRPGDLTGDGSVDLADLDQIRLAPVDLDGDGLANAADVDALERHVRRATPLAAAATPFGSGCVGRSRSFYERFATSAFDLASSRMRLAYDPAGFYVVSANGAYVAPTAAATVLPLADDGTALVTLASPLSHPGGVTSTLEVCANGFVSAAAGNEPGYTPTVAAWLASPRARWGCWHDFNPQAVGGGRVKFEQIGSVSYVTWDGVVSYGTNSPATFQLQFDRATGNVTYAWGAVALAGNEWLVGFAAPAPNADLGARNLSAAAAATFATDAAELAPLALAGSRPELGSTASLTTSSLPPSTAIVVQALGVSRVQPALELTSFGMPGCFLHADLTALFVAPVVAGVAVHLLVVPNDASLVGYPVYAQSAALAAGVNDAGIVTSNGVELRVGL